MKCNITLINHASFSIEWEDDLLLMDPWYNGRIFNNSWSLIKDTDLDSIKGIEKLSKIVISHEHPDHLHWPTLRSIKNKIPNNNITVYLPFRSNDNVKKKIEQIGFKFEYLPATTKTYINKNLTLCSFPTGHDAAIVFELDKTVVLNQNDAYLTDSELDELLYMYPSIDYWWMQFSLAGYYANRSNPAALMKKGHEFHIERFEYYKRKINPKVSIPFASFCYFCKYYNSYLNDYVVKPSHLLEKDSSIKVLYYSDSVAVEDSINNSLKWDAEYDKDRIIDSVPPTIPLNDILSASHSMFAENDFLLSQIDDQYKPRGYFVFYDYPRKKTKPFVSVYLDFVKKELKTMSTIIPPKNEIAGITSSEEFYFYLKELWGPDTLNITGCFEKVNESLWNNMLVFKDQLYKR